MTAKLVLPEQLAQQLADTAHAELETGAVLLAGIGRGESLRLTGRELHWVTGDAYEHRTPTSLQIRSFGYVAALRRAEEIGAAALWVHTHPGSGSDPSPSKYDRIVDDQLTGPFRIRSGSPVYGSLVVSPATRWFRFHGSGLDAESKFEIGSVVVVGDRFALLSGGVCTDEAHIPQLYDRQVRAFGGAIQRVLGQLQVAVVGCGGTGSAVAEQLVRLGVRDLVLADPDRLSMTNVTRVYGSSPTEVGAAKVDVVGRNLQRIAPDVRLRRYIGAVTGEDVARALASSDIVFGCTDDNAGRLVLTRLASFYLIPLIDCGVLISSSGGSIRGIDGRVTVQVPGAACLVCRDRINLERAAAEQLGPDEQMRLAREGYAPELGRVEPAVVTYTTSVASYAVTELIERLTGYGPEPVPTETLIRFHERELSTNLRAPRPRHLCAPGSAELGAGDREPFLGQLWRSK